MVTVIVPVFVVVLAEVVVNAGVGALKATVPLTTRKLVVGAPIAVVTVTMWFPWPAVNANVNVALMLVGVTVTPVTVPPTTVTVLPAVKFVPVMVTGIAIPRGPEAGEMPVMVGP